MHDALARLGYTAKYKTQTIPRKLERSSQKLVVSTNCSAILDE